MRARALRLFLGAMLPVVPATQAFAWDEPAKGEAAIYSTLCHSVRAGDQGERVTVLNSYTHFNVVYQEATMLMSPSIGLAEIFGGQISFQVQASTGEILAFKGTITPDYIAGQFAGDSQRNHGKAEVRWPRVAAESSVPDCPSTR